MNKYDKRFMKYQELYSLIGFKPIKKILVLMGAINRRKKKKHHE